MIPRRVPKIVDPEWPIPLQRVAPGRARAEQEEDETKALVLKI
jgi:hypothetical protein